MKKIVIHIFIFISFAVNAQSVFTRVLKNPESVKNNMFLLDSCNAANYFKDSVLYYKGYLALKQNDLPSAKLYCKELIKTFPAFAEAHYLNGLIYLSGKNYG